MIRKNYFAALLFALALFGCGVFTGAFGFRYYESRPGHVRGPEDFRKQYLKDMETYVHVTPEQEQRLKVIMDETRAQFRKLREDSRPAILQIKAAHTAKVKAILTPEQIPAYERLVAEHDRHSRDQDRSSR